jgi:hypothetical protein
MSGLLESIILSILSNEIYRLYDDQSGVGSKVVEKIGDFGDWQILHVVMSRPEGRMHADWITSSDEWTVGVSDAERQQT